MSREGLPTCVLAAPWQPGDPERLLRHGIGVSAAPARGQWTLSRNPAGALELRAPAAAGALCISVDPRGGALAHRLRSARKDQPLPRAAGLARRGPAPTVFDATAGLGRDALLLAHLGCAVTACERVPALAALLEDAAERAGLVARLRVVCGDAVAVLAALPPGDRPDVVCLDPMYPVRGTAQVKKEMQVCRLLAAPPTDAAELLRSALAVARERVVVKRHPHAQALGGKPAFAVAGARVRFDVYLTAP